MTLESNNKNSNSKTTTDFTHYFCTLLLPPYTNRYLPISLDIWIYGIFGQNLKVKFFSYNDKTKTKIWEIKPVKIKRLSYLFAKISEYSFIQIFWENFFWYKIFKNRFFWLQNKIWLFLNYCFHSNKYLFSFFVV